MQPSNFHGHCTFCDGRSHPEDFVRFALSRHLRAYGFSSHSPLPFETYWNMSAGDMPEYIQEITRLKKKYSGQIEIYLGLEIDYLSDTYNASRSFFRSLPLDYRIGSIHFMPWQFPLKEKNMVCIDGSYEEFAASIEQHYHGSIQALTGDYFEHSMRMVEAGGIDIVGHIDKVYMNGSRHPDFDIRADWYQKPFEACLDLVAQKGLIIEINTKNLKRKHQTYPHLDALKLVHKHAVPIMVNSDCHLPDLVDDGRSEALSILKETGFRTTRELVAGAWQDIAID
jgi:histidinol-phosphatase (PHP family)